jgi:hypothetical protein
VYGAYSDAMARNCSKVRRVAARRRLAAGDTALGEIASNSVAEAAARPPCRSQVSTSKVRRLENTLVVRV